MRFGLLAVLLAVGVTTPARASCPMCSTGAAALGSPGADVPFDARVRLGAVVTSREVAYGTVDLSEVRADAVATWAPVAPLVLSIDTPVVYRHASDGSEVVGLGNVQLAARWVVVRDRRLAPEHLLSIVVGTLLPSPRVDAQASTLSYAAIGPGSMTTGMIGGVAYVGRHGNLALSLACTATAWLDGPGLSRLGPGLVASVGGQWDFSAGVALRLGVDARYNALSLGSLGRADPDSGGLVLSVGPDLVFTLGERVLLGIGARLPVAHVDTGARREGLSLNASFIVDV